MTNFIRWNSSTHIYELSTNDGVSFVPLPLDASILNEGTVAVARIPNLDAGKITTGVFGKAQLPASIAYEDEANTFSQQQSLNGNMSISNTFPVIYYYNPSGALNQKCFRHEGHGSIFRIASLIDTLTAYQGYMDISSGGNLSASGTITATGNIYSNGVASPHGEWVIYTPTMTGGGFAIGNGTYQGRYMKINKTVWFEYRIVFGSTTTIGSGSWSVALPPFESLLPYIGVVSPGINGTAQQAAGGKQFPIYGVTGSPTGISMTSMVNGFALSPTNPFTFVANDTISLAGFYESTA